MLSCKKISAIPLLALVLTLQSCMEHKILFSFENNVNTGFFREIPGLGSARYGKFPVTKKPESIEVYVSSFSEKFIEKDNLLEYSELNDSTKLPYAAYYDVKGYSQDLYLLKYEFTYSATSNGKSFDMPAEAAIFFSVKYNSNGETLGVTPCYFGIINTDDNFITFDNKLSLKKDKDQFYLKTSKANVKMDGLLFIPANFPVNPETSEAVINIEKIVRLDPNKVGGYKPLVFNISEIFHDPNALQFHFVNKLHLTP